MAGRVKRKSTHTHTHTHTHTQARRLGDRLADTAFVAFFSSDLERTRQVLPPTNMIYALVHASTLSLSRERALITET